MPNFEKPTGSIEIKKEKFEYPEDFKEKVLKAFSHAPSFQEKIKEELDQGLYFIGRRLSDTLQRLEQEEDEEKTEEMKGIYKEWKEIIEEQNK